MSEIKHCKIEDIPASHKCDHEGYEYFRRKFIPFGAAGIPWSVSMRFRRGNPHILITSTIRMRRPSVFSAERGF